MDLVEHLLLLLVAFAANAFSAFAGGGAGLIQLPALIFLGCPSVPLSQRTRSPALLSVSARPYAT